MMMIKKVCVMVLVWCPTGIWYPVGDEYGRIFVLEVGFGY